MDVVFHINDREKWQEVLTNVLNLLISVKEELSIEIVANGGAIKGYLDHSLEDDMLELHKQNVAFSCCQNAMTSQKVTQLDLFSFVGVVPVGVLRLVELQHEGFAYIKP